MEYGWMIPSAGQIGVVLLVLLAILLLTAALVMLCVKSMTVLPEVVSIHDPTLRQGKLLFCTGCMAGKSVNILDGETLTLGRSQTRVQVVIDGMYRHVSNLHCTVTYRAQENCYYVTDFSTNGTYREKQVRMAKGKALRVPCGQAIYLGSSQCGVLLLAANERKGG